MPLCAPKVPVRVHGVEWQTVKVDSSFRVERTGKSKYRIVLRANDLLIGENYNDERQLLKDWAFLHPEESSNLFDLSGAATTNKLLEYHDALQRVGVDLSAEEQFKDYSAYLGSIMTIMEVLNTVKHQEASFSLKEMTSLVSLMSSLATQLCVCARNLIERRIKPKMLVADLKKLQASTSQARWDAVIQRASEIPVEEDASLYPSPSGTDEKELLMKLVTAVEELHELSTQRHASARHIKLLVARFHKQQEMTLSVATETVVTPQDLFESHCYFTPTFDKPNKAIDQKWCNELAGAIRSNGEATLPEKELEDQVHAFLTNRILNGGDNNPMGRYIQSVVTQYNAYIADQSGFIDIAMITQDDILPTFSTQVREDLDTLIDLLLVGLKLTFDVFAANDKLCDIARKSLRDITATRLFNVFSPKYRDKNHSKDEQLLHQCDRLKGADVSEVLGLREKIFGQLNAMPLALQEAFSYGTAFVVESSIRAKYNALEQMSNTICSVASTALKRADNRPDNDPDPKYAIGADDFLPLLSYTLLQARIPGLYSELAYVTDWTDDLQMLGKQGYLLASLQTASQFIINIDADQVIARNKKKFKQEKASILPSRPKSVVLPPLDAEASPASVSEAKTAKARVNSTSLPKTASLSTSLDSAIPLGAAAAPAPLGRAGSTSRLFSSVDKKTGTALDQNSAREISIDEDMWVLNGFVTFTGDEIDGELAYNLSLKLLSHVIAIYQRYSSLIQPATDTDKPLAKVRGVIQSDEIYKNFKVETCQLQKVNVNSLTGNARLAFFLNIYHTLALHCYIEKDVADSLFGRLKQQQSCAYSIGGVECSLLEIEHGILRYHTTHPDIFGANLFTKRWKSKDWNKKHFVVETPHPLVTFAVCQLTADSPPLRVYVEENVEQLIRFAAVMYLRKEVEIKMDENTVTLPKLLEYYKKDFAKTNPELLQFVAGFLPTEQASQLEALAAKKNTKLKFKGFDWLKFKFSFEITPQVEIMKAAIAPAPKSDAAAAAK